MITELCLHKYQESSYKQPSQLTLVPPVTVLLEITCGERAGFFLLLLFPVCWGVALLKTIHKNDANVSNCCQVPQRFLPLLVSVSSRSSPCHRPHLGSCHSAFPTRWKRTESRDGLVFTSHVTLGKSLTLYLLHFLHVYNGMLFMACPLAHLPG